MDLTDKIQYGPHLFPGDPEWYIRTGDRKLNPSQAHHDIQQTLIAAFDENRQDSILSQLASQSGLDTGSKVRLAFLNYGNTQLVYLAAIPGVCNISVLINQPHIPLGKVKAEFSNLQRLAELDSRFVIRPIAHFALPEAGHELYASEYIDGALCIAVENAHGIYSPEPEYHFESFLPGMSPAINAAMISLLVNYYDEKRGRGLAQTETCGNDFMLASGFERDNPASILPNIKLIAARQFIGTTLDLYLNLLRTEFLVGTARSSDKQAGRYVINTRSQLPMAGQEIESGIELGLELRAQRLSA